VARRLLLETFAVDEILADSRRVVTTANTVDYIRHMYTAEQDNSEKCVLQVKFT